MIYRSRLKNDVLLGQRDLLIMQSLYQYKILTREQINTYFFPGASKHTVNRRLRKLLSIGMIKRTNLFLDHNAMSIYQIARRGLGLINSEVSYKIQAKALKSTCPFHDAALFDIYKVFEKKEMHIDYFSNSVLQIEPEFKKNSMFLPFVLQNCDAVATFKTKIGELPLAIEFDYEHQGKTKYKNKFKQFYCSKGIDGVLYICKNEDILSDLKLIDKETAYKYQSDLRVYFALLDDVLDESKEMIFKNAENYIFTIK